MHYFNIAEFGYDGGKRGENGAMGLANWYDETILPHLVKMGCTQDAVRELRGRVIPRASGRVFEIGCGGGLNQPFYDRSRVDRLCGIDPNATLLEGALEHAAALGWDADIRPGRGEAIPFADGAFDTVVCTYTLCSVENAPQVLAEMRRVLKPGGRLLYLEHGRAPDPAPRKWQNRIEPFWKRAMGNCHLTREVGGSLRRAGFAVEPIGQEYIEKTPRWAGWTEWGVAHRIGA